MKNNLLIFISIYLIFNCLPGTSFGDLLSETDIDKIIRLCSAGQSTTAISKMRETIHKIEDDVELKKDKQHKEVEEKTDVGAIFLNLIDDNESKSNLYSKYIECVEMYLDKSLYGNKEIIKINYYLPQNETISPEMPVLIIDGKVALTLTRIKEGAGRKPQAHIRIQIPRRKDYTGWRYNGQSISFQYFDKTYKLYITNIKINNNTANVTIQEM